jgi:dTMP kinase
MKQGLFITFEGPDGSGKTTISQHIHDALVKLGYPVIYTREPGGIDIAEQIRQVVLDPKNTAMDVKTEALLYAASRRQHFVEKVLPALQQHQIVLCDRFIDSSLAYQGYGREIGVEAVLAINEFAIEGHYPDLTIYLDLSAQGGLKRIRHRHYLDRLDQESEAFHRRVVEGYQQVVQAFPHRIVRVDASQALNKVKKKALQLVLKKVQEHES